MSDPERLWNRISNTALLGTQRRPFSLSGEDGSLARLLASSDGQSSQEELLLRVLAATVIRQRAGSMPPQGAPAPYTACPADTWQPCTTQAAAFLGPIFIRQDKELLKEWLALAARRQQRVPEAYLYDLLLRWDTLDEHQDLAAVLGERGLWFARLTTKSVQDAAEPDHTWETVLGDRGSANDFIRYQRVYAPQDFRGVITQQLNRQPYSFDLWFLRLFKDNLSLEDEPLLERILENRRGATYETARLLARLPGSQLVTRMTARGLEMLRWKPGLLRGALEVHLPDALSPEIARDGIIASPYSGLYSKTIRFGLPASWLAQIMGLVPPRAWCQAWRKRPTQILEAARGHELEENLLFGWKAAAVNCQDEEWQEALLNHESRQDEPQRVQDLFPRLVPSVKERWFTNLLRSAPSLAHDQPAAVALAACRHNWSIEMTRTVTTAICTTLQKGSLQPWHWEKLLRDIPPYFHPDLLETSIRSISTALARKISVDPYAETLVDMLRFRLEMRQAFSAIKPPSQNPRQEPT